MKTRSVLASAAQRHVMVGLADMRLLPLMADYMADKHRECAVVAGFDNAGRLRAFRDLSGSSTAIETVMPAFRAILAESSVCEIVMAHSHPTSPSTPSAQDRITTDRLSALARLAGAMLSEHLIFGSDGVHSMAENRLVARPRPLKD